MKRKWKDAQGETLVEALAAILIGALSVALLFTAVTASASLDKRAKDVDEPFHTALANAEKQETPVTETAIIPDTAKVTVEGNGVTAAPPVSFYGGEGVLSYKLSP